VKRSGSFVQSLQMYSYGVRPLSVLRRFESIGATLRDLGVAPDSFTWTPREEGPYISYKREEQAYAYAIRQGLLEQQAARNGAPDARGASASSNDDTASTAADTRAPSEWTAGLVSASSPTASSTSVALWKSRRLLESSRPPAAAKWLSMSCSKVGTAALSMMPHLEGLVGCRPRSHHSSYLLNDRAGDIEAIANGDANETAFINAL
jgi:hypothetical protein